MKCDCSAVVVVVIVVVLAVPPGQVIMLKSCPFFCHPISTAFMIMLSCFILCIFPNLMSHCPWSPQQSYSAFIFYAFKGNLFQSVHHAIIWDLIQQMAQSIINDCHLCSSCMFGPLQGHRQGGIYKGIEVQQIYLPDNDLVDVGTCKMIK